MHSPKQNICQVPGMVNRLVKENVELDSLEQVYCVEAAQIRQQQTRSLVEDVIPTIENRRWLTLKPVFLLPSLEGKALVMDFLLQHCQFREQNSFMKQILHRYSFLVEYVAVDTPGMIVQPSRFDRLAQFVKDVRDGTFQNMVADFLRTAKNNHGFEITWNIDVTVEGVSEEVSDDPAQRAD